MKITRTQASRFIGNLAVVLLLILNGKDFLANSADVISILNQA